MKTISTLHDLQQQFSHAVLGKPSPELELKVKDNPFSSRQRLNIYSNNVTISLRNALKDVYPVVHRLVGDEFFAAMSRDFIVKHPSRSGNLHNFGQQLAEFIAGFTPAGDLVYLADVARLEWSYHIVFHAAEAQTFNIEELQKVDPVNYGNLRFALSPAARLVSSNYPILRIWQANQEHIDCVEDETILLDEGESRILVLRRNLDIEFHELSCAEFSFLTALDQKDNFFSACDAATKFNSDCDVGQLLQKHILSQAITGFDLTQMPPPENVS